ncbi:MAG: stage III sporulation protein AA [Defluviitaleaceae bacterium]|nr:stage III sporulation protein AA [Defluviitaleaceae bacterium]
MENISAFLGSEVARRLVGISGRQFEKISEIRLRVDKPMIVRIGGRDYFVVADSFQGSPLVSVIDKAYRPNAEDIRETMERISQYSFYAFESELSQGYITLPKGHRVGVVGQAVLEDGAVRAWRYISGLNIRVAHSVLGCADDVLPQILNADGLMHTMIISPPGFGKTTLLRDIVRQISDGGLTVGLADERSEVAGCFRGVAQNDVGIRTDVLDGCPKALAMVMLLRAMSPDVIAVDELGGEADARSLDTVLNAGVKILCTAHGNDVEDAMKNPALTAVLGRGIFQRFIVLDKPTNVAGVFDGKGVKI